MAHRKTRTLRVVVEQELLKEHPQLAKLPEHIDFSRLNTFINAIENRPERMKTAITNDVLRISAKKQIIHGRLDYLGLEVPSQVLSDVCDVVFEETHVDPRRENVYSKRGSAFEGLSDEAMIEPNFITRKRTRHPLDRISCEEIALRRELAEKRWESHRNKTKDRRIKVEREDEKDRQHAIEFFFGSSRK